LKNYEDSHSAIEISLDQLRNRLFSIKNEKAYSPLLTCTIVLYAMSRDRHDRDAKQIRFIV